MSSITLLYSTPLHFSKLDSSNQIYKNSNQEISLATMEFKQDYKPINLVPYGVSSILTGAGLGCLALYLPITAPNKTEPSLYLFSAVSISFGAWSVYKGLSVFLKGNKKGFIKSNYEVLKLSIWVSLSSLIIGTTLEIIASKKNNEGLMYLGILPFYAGTFGIIILPPIVIQLGTSYKRKKNSK